MPLCARLRGLGGQSADAIALHLPASRRPRFLRDLPFPGGGQGVSSAAQAPRAGTPRSRGAGGTPTSPTSGPTLPFPQPCCPLGEEERSRGALARSGRRHWQGLLAGRGHLTGSCRQECGTRLPRWVSVGAAGEPFIPCSALSCKRGPGFSGPWFPGRVRFVLLRARPHCRNGRASEPLMCVKRGRAEEPRPGEAGLDSSRTRHRGKPF